MREFIFDSFELREDQAGFYFAVPGRRGEIVINANLEEGSPAYWGAFLSLLGIHFQVAGAMKEFTFQIDAIASDEGTRTVL